MSPLVSYIITTHDRRDELTAAIESIQAQEYEEIEVAVVIDNSTDGTVDLFADEGQFSSPEITSRYLDEWDGTPEARNIGADLTDGEILVFMDDDAVLESADATDRIVEKFQTDADLGLLALCIKNYYTGEIIPAEFPHRNHKPSREESFETTYFVGAGHAIRASVLAAAGGYPSEFTLYRFEEIDLSFRVLSEGYRIRYVPSVVVQHKQSPEGRSPDDTIKRYELENRIRTSIRNLPWRYVTVSTAVWTAYTLYRVGFDPRPVLAGLAAVIRDASQLRRERSPLGPETIDYLKTHSGRLYY